MNRYFDVDTLADRVNDLQPLPEVATRVMQLAESTEFSAGDLAAVVSSDQALTAKLLRLANSAYYGFSRRIATVRDAVVLLGFREVRALAMAASVMDLFSTRHRGPFNLDLFWGHSVAAALVAESLAKETGYAAPEESYTAGILHDVGKLILNQYMPQEYAAVVEIALGQGLPIHQAEQRTLGFTHAAVGAKLAERWRFPPQLTAAVGDHHRANISRERSPLTYVVARANAMCHEYGLWAGFEYDDAPEVRFKLDEGDPVRTSLLRRLGGMEAVEERAKAFLSSTMQRPFTWYQKTGAGDAARRLSPEDIATITREPN